MNNAIQKIKYRMPNLVNLIEQVAKKKKNSDVQVHLISYTHMANEIHPKMQNIVKHWSS